MNFDQTLDRENATVKIKATAHALPPNTQISPTSLIFPHLSLSRKKENDKHKALTDNNKETARNHGFVIRKQ